MIATPSPSLMPASAKELASELERSSISFQVRLPRSSITATSSGWITAPVMNPAALVDRNSTRPTRSIGTSSRWMHWLAMSAALPSGVTVARGTSVNVPPGCTAFTVIPCGPSSRASELVIPTRAALDVT